MIQEPGPLIWVAAVVSAIANAIVFNRMMNRLRPIHPFVRYYNGAYWVLRFAPIQKLYRLTFREDRRAMRLWYWHVVLSCLMVLLFILAIGTSA